MTDTIPNPSPDLYRLKQTVLNAYNRHFIRAQDRETALDLTYYFFKHYGITDNEWETVQIILQELGYKSPQPQERTL